MPCCMWSMGRRPGRRRAGGDYDAISTSFRRNCDFRLLLRNSGFRLLFDCGARVRWPYGLCAWRYPSAVCTSSQSHRAPCPAYIAGSHGQPHCPMRGTMQGGTGTLHWQLTRTIGTVQPLLKYNYCHCPASPSMTAKRNGKVTTVKTAGLYT